MVEGARLESVYTPKAYRGFESRPLRHVRPMTTRVPMKTAECGLGQVMHEAGLVNLRQEPAEFKLREPRDMRIVGNKPVQDKARQPVSG